MLLFDRTTNPGVIAVIVGIAGVGIGFTFQPTMVAFQAHATKSQRAVVISDRNYFRCLGGACGLAVSAALLQATLKSNLPDGYQNLAHSTYSLPSKSSISEADWENILTAYAKASHAVFILQVPLIGLAFIACTLIRDRGLERPKDPHEEEAIKEQQKQQQQQQQNQEKSNAQDQPGQALGTEVTEKRPTPGNKESEGLPSSDERNPALIELQQIPAQN